MKYIDCHNHVLWDVDDGLQTLEESQFAIEQAVKDGYAAICVTPHVIPGITTKEHLDDINNKFNMFRVRAEEHKLCAYLGCELMMNYDMIDALDDDVFLTMNNSRYLLVEFSLSRDINFIDYLDEYLHKLIERGYKPIIAHVERYFPKGIDIDKVRKWVGYGCIIQINRTSLLGMFGGTLKDNCEKLLKNKLVSLVCSDAHTLDGTRILRLSDTYQVLCSLVGIYNAGLLLYENPLNIINDIDTILLR